MVRKIPRVHTRGLEKTTFHCSQTIFYWLDLLAVQDDKGEEVMKASEIFNHPIILTIGLLAALKSLGIISLDFKKLRGE